MPLPESCPESLTEKPSDNKVPNAKFSAVDQSIGLSFSNIFSLKSKIFLKVLCATNSFGIVEIFLPI